MADKFAFTITYGPDGMEYQSPEIIERIYGYLQGNAPLQQTA